MEDTIGKGGIYQNRDSMSLWRVYLPTDIDREKYVQTCYLTGTVSLVNDNAEIKHRVKIGQLALQLVTFPKKKEQLGSEVICITAPYSGILYVVDVYNSSQEFTDQKEFQYRLTKSDGDIGFAELKVDGRGRILLSVDGKDDQAEITLAITSKNKQGRLNVNVNGDILVQNEGTTSLISNSNVSVKVNDGKVGGVESSVNIKKDEVKVITAGKIYLNESEEPVLLGAKTVQFLSDLLDQLGQESAGPYPLLGNSFYLQLKQSLEDLKSTISFVK